MPLQLSACFALEVLGFSGLAWGLGASLGFRSLGLGRGLLVDRFGVGVQQNSQARR